MSYRNKFEEQTATELSAQSISFEYETERLPYTITASYIPDFILFTRGGRKIYIETKGNGRSFDGASRRKLIAVRSQHPEKDLRIIFWSDGKFGPTRKDGTRQTQIGWATKNGFQCAVRNIPDGWYE